MSCSELEGQESSIIWLISSGNLQEVNEGLSLSGETVNDVLLMVGDWSLEEETQVGEDWSHRLIIDRHSCEELTQDDHVVHQWTGQEGIRAHGVCIDGVDTVHEDQGRVLIEGSLGILHEWNILDDDFVVDGIISLWV